MVKAPLVQCPHSVGTGFIDTLSDSAASKLIFKRDGEAKFLDIPRYPQEVRQERPIPKTLMGV